MDYDKTDMPRSYDRARGYSPAVLQLWLDTLSAHLPRDRISDIIDLGCGTGRYSGPLAEHFDADLLGIDPSEKMLDQARGKNSSGRVTFRRSAGEALPAAAASADLVFMSMVFHHLRDPEQTARECHRVLRHGGHLCLRTATLEQIESYPYVDFFPGVREVIETRMPPRDRIRTVFGAAGFESDAHDIIAHEMAPNWPAFADKMALRADSTVADLPEEAFQAGLSALRSYAERADPLQVVTVNVELFVFRRGDA